MGKDYELLIGGMYEPSPPSPRQLAQLWLNCQGWIKKNKPRCAESIYQMDSVMEALPELAQDVCNIVGYYKEEKQ